MGRLGQTGHMENRKQEDGKRRGGEEKEISYNRTQEEMRRKRQEG